MEFDLLDKKLLSALDEDARQTISNLAKKLHIHRNVALYRLKRLEDSGILRGYYAEINYYALGFTSYRIFLKLGNATTSAEEEFIAYVKREPRIIWFLKMSGSWHYDIVFLAKSAWEFCAFYEALALAHNRIISEKRVSVLIQIKHFNRDYLLSSKREFIQDKQFNLSKVYSLDAAEWSLLHAVAYNANAPIIDLATKTKLSVNTVKAKLTWFRKNGIIMGYRPFIDTDKSGYHYYRLHLNLKDYDLKTYKSLQTYLQSNPWLVYFDTYIGGDDIELEMHVPSENDLLNYIDELRKKFGAIILSHMILKFSKEYIFRYLPAN